MPSIEYVALLRGINLGRRRLTMDRLRELFVARRLGDVATFIASGNVLFSSGVRDPRKLETQIERHLAKSLGYEVDTFVRTRAEVAAVAAAKPFAAADLDDPAHTIHVGFLKEPLPEKSAAGLAAIRTETDAFHVAGREFYWLCRIRSVDSKVWASPAMKAVKLPTVTMRNRRMLLKLTAQFPAGR
jgi:uncharacterized protein (DUF1697 family)